MWQTFAQASFIIIEYVLQLKIKLELLTAQRASNSNRVLGTALVSSYTLAWQLVTTQATAPRTYALQYGRTEACQSEPGQLEYRITH